MNVRSDTENRRQGRCWRFASAVLDERSWTLTVNGRMVPIEAKPMELLHELVRRAGETVSKDELLAAVWPEVSVVEGSLATAMLKVRRALGDEGAACIQTVPRVGYKLAVPVVQDLAETPVPAQGEGSTERTLEKLPPQGRVARRHRHWGAMVVGALLATAALGVVVQALRPSSAASARPAVSQLEARDALRHLDLPKIRALLEAGWDPNVPVDRHGSAALHVVVEICEWDPGHDRQKLLLAARTLLDAGGLAHKRNVWGDTPYSIARAKRYCGTDHPVTHLLHVVCYQGTDIPRDRCLADYSQAAANRRKP